MAGYGTNTYLCTEYVREVPTYCRTWNCERFLRTIWDEEVGQNRGLGDSPPPMISLESLKIFGSTVTLVWRIEPYLLSQPLRASSIACKIFNWMIVRTRYHGIKKGWDSSLLVGEATYPVILRMYGHAVVESNQSMTQKQETSRPIDRGSIDRHPTWIEHW